MGIPEEEKGQEGTEETCEAIMAKNFPTINVIPLTTDLGSSDNTKQHKM